MRRSFSITGKLKTVWTTIMIAADSAAGITACFRMSGQVPQPVAAVATRT